MFTLVVLGMQNDLLCGVKNKNQFLYDVGQEIVYAKNVGNGIIVCSFNTTDVDKRILDIVGGYDKKIIFEGVSNNVGEEVLAIISQQRFDKNHIKICGLYLDDHLSKTKQGILYCTNYQVKIDLLNQASRNFDASFFK